MKLALQIITYNSEKYLPFLFDSLRKQSFNNWQLLILDNGSHDRTIEIIQEEFKTIAQKTELIISKENTGFAGGHNNLFKKTDSEYVVLLNPDMYLISDCLEKLVQFLETHPDTAVVSPRLMTWDFSKAASQNIEDSFTDSIDSLGLKVYRSRRVVEWMAGKKYEEIKQNFGNSLGVEVFGVSGALPLFRRSALEAVQDDQKNIFDPLFFMYKEDVDLAFRLREAGYKAYVKLDAVAYHDRSAAMPKKEGDRGAAINKKDQSELIKYHSYKNHLMMLYKNEYWQNFILDFPWIFWYEFKKFMWFLLFDRKTLKGIGEIGKNQKILKSERRYIQEKIKKISWKEMRNLFAKYY